MQHVLDIGHRRIGIIAVPERLNFSIAHRIAGLRDVANGHGLGFDSLPQVGGDFSIQSGVEGARQLLEVHPDVTAIICLNDRMALGAIQHACRVGRVVPDDLRWSATTIFPVPNTRSLPLQPLISRHRNWAELPRKCCLSCWIIRNRSRRFCRRS